MLIVITVYFVLLKNGSLQESLSFLEEENKCVKSKVTEIVEDDDVICFGFLSTNACYCYAWCGVWICTYITESCQSVRHKGVNNVIYVHIICFILNIFLSSMTRLPFVLPMYSTYVTCNPISLVAGCLNE